MESFIPNDCFISPSKSVAVISGPNSSGLIYEIFKIISLILHLFRRKSVYLKQVGLIVYMAHLGCFVPADRAIIGICDRYFS